MKRDLDSTFSMRVELTNGFYIDSSRFLRLRCGCGGGIWNTFNHMIESEGYVEKEKSACYNCKSPPTKKALVTYYLWAWQND